MGTRRILRKIAVVAALAAIVFLVAVASLRPLRWRAIIAFDKATGRLNDIEWSDLRWMFRPGSSVDLEVLAESRNPFEAVANPLHSKSDVDAGDRIFREKCSACHGDGAHGGPGGPDLHDHVFKRGRSDWALYQTITLGLPGTAMPAWKMPRDDAWKLVGYLNTELIQHNSDGKSGQPGSAPVSIQPVAPAELRDAGNQTADWLTYSGSYASQRYSRSRQITRENVGQLRVEWQRQLATSEDKVEASPIVRGSTMFVTEPPGSVLALDAATGRVLWTYTRDLPSPILLCCGPVNRGVAVLGDRVFVGTLDAHLVALDAGTGRVLWDVETANHSTGYSITGAPLAIDDMVLTGVAGGEYRIRGFIDAYDAATGRRRWRFYTVPVAGDPGIDSWGGDPGGDGGAPTWLTGSYDPALRLIYWGTGNPSPNYYGEKRQGDNLYSNCILAIDVDSGKLRWYFQFTPHDLHDWDAVQIPVLFDAVLNGTKRQLIAQADRNGFYYVLDRATGEFLSGTPYVTQTWADGLDEKGRPKVRPEATPSRAGAVVYPSVTGGTNWWSPAYDPELQAMFVPTIDRGSIFYARPDLPVDDQGENLGGDAMMLPNENMKIAVKALDAATGRVRWQYFRPPRQRPGQMGGLLSTAGKIVFGGDLETVFALDSESGAELWHLEVGGVVQAGPVSYEIAGRQYLAVAAGRSIMAFALPLPNSAKKSTHPTGR
jgi:alcohol dehydrogenase (cytochrome c)